VQAFRDGARGADRSHWIAAWGVEATIMTTVCVALALTKGASPAPSIASGVLAVLGLYFVFSALFHWWPFARLGGLIAGQEPLPGEGDALHDQVVQMSGHAAPAVSSYVATLGGGLIPREEYQARQAQQVAGEHAKVLEALRIAITNGERLRALATDSTAWRQQADGWCRLAGAFVQPTPKALSPDAPFESVLARIDEILAALRESLAAG